MNIRQLPIKYNFSERKGTKVKYIVIHDTGNKKRGAGAYNHYLYFNGGDRNASAHYFVDSKEIIQTVPDHLSAWHTGDGKGRYGVTNANSIGIEICINPDSDYKKAVADTLELTRYLMDKHQIPPDNVIRHYDGSRKLCPASMAANNWQAWHEFKAQLVASDEGKVKVNIKGKMYYIDGLMQNEKNYVSVRELAEAMGYDVGWDNINKVVMLK